MFIEFPSDIAGILVCIRCDRMLDITVDSIVEDYQKVVDEAVAQWFAIHHLCSVAEVDAR